MFQILMSLAMILVFVGVALVAYYVLFRSDSNDSIRQFLGNPQSNTDLTSDAFTQCSGAPFIIPSDGFIGLLWRDDAAPYTPLRRHTGIDIFGGQAQGQVPIYAVYDGWLTRLDNWESTVIIRHNDPLQAGRTIWTYYTHMASRDGNQTYIVDEFPKGTYSIPITQGTLLGYQGAYNPPFPIAIHLHLSIVTSDADGSFKNEAILENTLDPSPYFGIDLNADSNQQRPVTCAED